MNCRNALLLALPCLMFSSVARSENWPAWRGPTGQGISTEQDLPVSWSATENVRWKVALPESGNSSPIVWGDRVFITQASERTLWPPQKPEDWPKGTSAGGAAIAERRSVMCFARSDGKLLWQSDVIYKEPESTHGTNPFCSATPVTDGERVIASHGSAGLVCYDFAGKQLWHRDLGKIEHVWGNASSPILYENLCILWCGPGSREFLEAVDKETGETMWRYVVDEEGSSGLEGKDFAGNWGTPLVVRIGDQDQLLLHLPEGLKGLDPATGKLLWSLDQRGSLIYYSPIYADGVVVLNSSAYPIGDTAPEPQRRLWNGRGGSRIGSGVVIDGLNYVLGDGGIPLCRELRTGEELWKGQLDKRPCTTAWGSLVHAVDKLYITDQRGTTIVLRAGQDYELLAANKLDEHCNASIAISNGDLFIRTWEHLWCIGKSEQE